MSGSIARCFPPTEQRRAHGPVLGRQPGGGVLRPRWAGPCPDMASRGWSRRFLFLLPDFAAPLVSAGRRSGQPCDRDDPGPASNGHPSVGSGVPLACVSALRRTLALCLLMAMYLVLRSGVDVLSDLVSDLCDVWTRAKRTESGSYAASPFVLGVLGEPGPRHPERRNCHVARFRPCGAWAVDWSARPP